MGAPEGLPQPVSVLPALAGVLSPEFPRVGGILLFADLLSDTVVWTSAAQKNYSLLHIGQFQWMLDYSRQDLQGFEHLTKDVIEVPGMDCEDRGLGRRCGGKH